MEMLLSNNLVNINERLYLGEIWIGKTDNVLPKTWKKCRIQKIKSVNKNEEIVKLQFDYDTTAIIEINTDFNYFEGIVSFKAFHIKFIQKSDLVYADLYLSELPLKSFKPKLGKIIKTTFALIYDLEFNENNLPIKYNANSHVEINHLYEEVKKYKEPEENSDVMVQHPALVPKLRPYQEEAVRWMLSREKICENKEFYLNPVYAEINLKGGEKIYLNKSNGFIETVRPLISSLRTGGILADEMGLGKTVEVLACILCNPCPHTTIDFCESSFIESEEELEESTSSPKKKGRKRKIKESNDNEKEKLYTDQTEELEVPKKKSANFLMLHKWYENQLSEMTIKKTPKIEEIQDVQCVCGNLNKEGTIKCNDCFKYQHISCFNYNSEYGTYRCPQCWESQPKVECKGTIIVCPPSLLEQWLTEIKKHNEKGLKVLHYKSRLPIYPLKLKEYDIVLTTYNVLQLELNVTETSEYKLLRRRQRYYARGSPIDRMKWWRICLDEAQTVEISSSKISEMACKLESQHRWAISGTPITKNISDLYGIINYLQFEPYDDCESWNYLLYLPYISGNKTAMYEFLGKILWRTSKDKILDQINIPPQTIEIHNLEFSAVERFFYNREHELSTHFFLDKLKNFDLNLPLFKLSNSNLRNVLAPLLSIRQSCSHPNVKGKYLTTKKQVDSMKDLLEVLIHKNNNESEEHLRFAISAINGIAGIYLLLNQPEKAVEEYRKILHLVAKFDKETVKTDGLAIDKLQLIHTLHNLAEVLDLKPAVAPTIRDANLRKDCLKVQQKYLGKYIKETINACKESISATSEVYKMQKKQSLPNMKWFKTLLNWCTVQNFSTDLVKKVENALEQVSINKAYEFPNEMNMLYKVGKWCENLMTLREETMDILQNMYSYNKKKKSLTIKKGVVEGATDCHLRPQEKNKKKTPKNTCLVCEANSKFKEYENKLFNTTKANNADQSNKGDWKPTMFEVVLKTLVSFAKGKNAEEICIKNGHYFCAQIENMKKEFKELRKFWTFLDRQICAQDEMEICKIRLMLKDPSQEQSSTKTRIKKIVEKLSATTNNTLQTIHMLDPHELNYQRLVLENEANQQLKELEKSLGTHGYLKTLKKDQTTEDSKEPCPICKTILDIFRSVLPCGHSYCLDCIHTLLEQTTANKISCSICREKHKIEDISYIRSRNDVKDDDKIEIKGNYSTKVEAVVKLIMKLFSQDKTVKILVFSNWKPILQIVGKALTENFISCELFLSAQMQNVLTKFKDLKKEVTALLLPILFGSKGLNLIEATHVILIEPVLNPGDELQAIGRVHRIGQTKPTFVHKFYVNKTIEENIHSATSTSSEKWDKNKVTLLELYNLFILNEENDESKNKVTSNTLESLITPKIEVVAIEDDDLSVPDEQPSTSIEPNGEIPFIT